MANPDMPDVVLNYLRFVNEDRTDELMKVRGEWPSLARACHSSSVFHSTKARKQTRMCAWSRLAC